MMNLKVLFLLLAVSVGRPSNYGRCESRITQNYTMHTSTSTSCEYQQFLGHCLPFSQLTMFSEIQAVYYWIKHVRFLPVSVYFKLTSNHARFYMLLLLLGCVEPNPGPVVNSYPCGVCTLEVEDFCARAIACNACDTWTHKSCVGMLTSDYDHLANSSTPWYCPDCGTPHHSDSEIIYDGLEDNSVGSTYSSVSDGEPVTPSFLDSHGLSASGLLSDTSINTVGSPEAASSPKTTQPSKSQSEKKSPRMLNINFQSIRKRGRNIDVLVETTNPDILFGTETWLAEDIPTASFFNPALGYSVYRRDRPNSPYGGVLLAVKKNIEVTNVHCHDDLEIITAAILSRWTRSEWCSQPSTACQTRMMRST